MHSSYSRLFLKRLLKLFGLDW